MPFWCLLLFLTLVGNVVPQASEESANTSSEDLSYSVLKDLLRSPVRQQVLGNGARQATLTTTGGFKPIYVAPTPTHFSPVDPSHDVISARNDTVDDSHPDPQPSNSNSNLTSARSAPAETNVIDDGVSKLAGIYYECSGKIDKRIEKLLNWKMSKTNTQKDLIQLKEYVLLLYRCLKVQSFRYFDTVIDGDVIPVTPFVDMVRDPNSVDSAFNFAYGRSAQSRVSPNYVSEVVNGDWSTLLLERLTKLLETHSMKFRVEDNEIEGRGRRRDHKMFAMMLMGFMIMSSILIPMGFQFLTVLGGKSLLMAKMALIMSAINGLKKIATSPVGYGFYHSGADVHDHHGHHGFHDKLYNLKREPEFL